MISPKVLGKHVEKFVLDNAPTILTGVGAIGAVATAYFTGKATVKAVKLVETEHERRFREDPKFQETDKLSKTEVLKVVWMEYLPPAGILTVTVGSIVCANRVSAKRITALAAAYSLGEKRFGEYREKVVEKFNPNKERQIQDEIAQDRINGNPPKDGLVIIGHGDVLCYDLPSDRYFHSNMEKLRKIMNDINLEVVETGYVTLEAFYAALNLSPTRMGDEIGWSREKMFEITFSAALTPDNQPCICINYSCDPARATFLQGCSDDPQF